MDYPAVSLTFSLLLGRVDKEEQSFLNVRYYVVFLV